MDLILGDSPLGEYGGQLQASVETINCVQTTDGFFSLIKATVVNVNAKQTTDGLFYLSATHPLKINSIQTTSGVFSIQYSGVIEIPFHLQIAPRQSVHRFCTTLTNSLAASSVNCDNVMPSNQFRKIAVERIDNGTVELSGEWRGKKDELITVDIIPNQSSLFRFTQNKQFNGTGNGDIETAIDDGVATQSITMSCVKVSKKRESASISLLGLSIQSKTSGESGNEILINSIQEITLTPSRFSLLSDMTKGDDDFTSDEWNFGGASINKNGTLPDTFRFCIGSDKTVYRQYREWRDGEWHYRITPAPKRNYSQGEKLYSVIGGYLVEITDGIYKESHTGVTAFDIFLSIQSSSQICNVGGRLQKELTPNGNASLDFPFKTNPYFLKQNLNGENVKPLIDLIIKSQASEFLLVKCIDNTITGKEKWSVSGTINGEMGTVESGGFFNGLHYQFQMPSDDMGKQIATGVFSHVFLPVERSEDESMGDVCPLNLTLGARASNKEVAFVYKKRIPAALLPSACEMPAGGKISGQCLGLNEDISEMGEIPEQLSTRLNSILNLSEVAKKLNTSVVSESLTVYRVVYSELDVDGTASESVVRPSSKNDVYGVRQKVIKFPAFKFQPLKIRDFSSEISADVFISTYLNKFGFLFEEEQKGVVSYGDLYTAAITTVTGKPFVVKIPMSRGGDILPDGRTAFRAKDLNLNVSNKLIGLAQTSLMQVYESPEGLVQWDEMWSDIQSVLAQTVISGSPIDDVFEFNDRYIERFEAKRDIALLASGIIPKSDGSAQQSGQCWVDKGNDYWWISEDGYMPAFSNSTYISARQKDGSPFSTKEFGFFLSVTGSPKTGDKLTIKIDGANNAVVSYQVGDSTEVPIISSSPLRLSGGENDDASFEWNLYSNKQGILPPLTSEIYSNNGINITLKEGAIPFSVGDSFQFDISDLQSQIKIGAGDLQIMDIKPFEINGTAFNFKGNFNSGDYHHIKAIQSNTYLNAINTKSTMWRWSGDAAQITLLCKSKIDTFVLIHALPKTALVFFDGLDELGDVLWTKEIDYKPRSMGFCEPSIIECDQLRLRIENATNGSIQWIYAGFAVRTVNNAQSLSIKNEFAMYRGQGINPLRSFRGQGGAGRLEWDNWLLSDDMELINSMIFDMQKRGELCVFIPNYHHNEFYVASLSNDSFEVKDYFQFQSKEVEKRRLSQSLEFNAVFG